MKIVYSEAARRDIAAILLKSAQLFGENQAVSYAQLLEKTIDLIAEQPDRPSSRDLSQFHPGLRALRMGIATGRLRSASHQVLYRSAPTARGKPCVEIVRVLHQSMDIAAHVALGLQGLD